MPRMIRFTVNNQDVSVDTPPMARLLDVLREGVRLTGTKEGCGEGECGACTVLIDGVAVNSCLVPAIQADGCRITTVEGLEADGRLHPVQEAFLKFGGAQCGICTPGFLVTAKALLDRNPHPTRAEAREALAGNLCRCTGYQKIIDAVTEALAAPPPAAGTTGEPAC
ncbi:MAG: (2Fe-2S)-binding protein [Pseudomonadota bacterium]|nr:(2Fe-2S)-binding protein [Pseudomonadota bacterium]